MIAAAFLLQAVTLLPLCAPVDHYWDMPENWPCETIGPATYPANAAEARVVARCLVEFEYRDASIASPCARCASTNSDRGQFSQDFVDAAIDTLAFGFSDRLNEGARYGFMMTFAGADETWPSPPAAARVEERPCLSHSAEDRTPGFGGSIHE